MRVWDFPPKFLYGQHLIAQHREVHILYRATTGKISGWKTHPETKRWQGRASRLIEVHDETGFVMLDRGYQHHTPLDVIPDITPYPQGWQSHEKQIEVLQDKGCKCDVEGMVNWLSDPR